MSDDVGYIHHACGRTYWVSPRRRYGVNGYGDAFTTCDSCGGLCCFDWNEFKETCAVREITDLLKEAIAASDERSRKAKQQSKQICYRFADKGSCPHGRECRFSHDQALVAQYLRKKQKPVCKHFATTGSCKFGGKCKYDHNSKKVALYLRTHSDGRGGKKGGSKGAGKPRRPPTPHRVPTPAGCGGKKGGGKKGGGKKGGSKGASKHRPAAKTKGDVKVVCCIIC